MKFKLRPLLIITLGFLYTLPGLANERGKKWFKLCISCHGESGEGNQKLAAPSIAGLPAWYIERQLKKFRDGIRGAHPRDAAGLRMRPMARAIVRLESDEKKMSDKQVALQSETEFKEIAAYVSSLPRLKPTATVKGNALKGEGQFALCATCHGANGEGNQTTGGPPLFHQNDWYLLTQLKNFKGKVRGASSNTDALGNSMAAMVTALSEESMADIVAYVNALGNVNGGNE